MRKSNKHSRPWQRQPSDRDEAAEVEAPDRLLLSALKFWEVERDLIGERMGAIGVRQSNPSAGAAGQSIQRKLDTTSDTALVKGNEHEKPNKGHAALKILAQHITQQLNERGFCVVFEHDLERCWPSSGMSQAEREGKIQAFAESQGWTAAILESAFGTRAIFRQAGTWLS
jgi:hypothetical protein